MIIISLLVFLLLVILIRIFFVIYKINLKVTTDNDDVIKESKDGKMVKTMICIGSGGHTAEMLKLVDNLNPKKYSPRIYVMANSDTTSEVKIEKTEHNFNDKSSNYKIIKISRSRKVHQSYISSVFTTVYSILESIPVLVSNKPDLVLCNGPGTCVPICFIAFLTKVFLLNRNVKIVFIESFCRVETLSLTGKILSLFADDIIVQWKQLLQVYKKAKYFGRLT